MYECGNIDDFVGHVGGDDFVILTTPEREKCLGSRILERYKEESKALYRREDLECGSISGSDRWGYPSQFPLVSLSIGVVSDGFQCSPRPVSEIGCLAAEAKRRAKQSSNNISRIWVDDWYYPAREPMPVSPTARPSNLLGRLQRKVSQLTEKDVIAEFK